MKKRMSDRRKGTKEADGAKVEWRELKKGKERKEVVRGIRHVSHAWEEIQRPESEQT